MKNKIYTIYNTLSKRYGDVFASASDGMAEKNCRIAMTRNGATLEDVELCRIGEIEIESGVVEACAPIRIAWNEENKTPVRETEKAIIS